MKIFITGRDYIGWATDDDFFLYKSVIEKYHTIVESPKDADLIHAINWTSLYNINLELLQSKPVVAQIPHDIEMMFENESLPRLKEFVDVWLAPSTYAVEKAKQYKIEAIYSPYVINEFFKSTNTIGETAKNELREKFNLPKGKFLIGSFQRDTQGYDLSIPKTVKGPDIFVEIIRKLENVHIVLAGPRRQWIKKQLVKYQIPFTFVGEEVKTDKEDLEVNNLSKEMIKELYQSIDLYIVSSRLEGGPKAISECISTKTPIISTPVGHVKDCLPDSQIYTSIEAGIELVKQVQKDEIEFSTENPAKHDFNVIEAAYKQASSTFSRKKMLKVKLPNKFLKYLSQPKTITCFYETKDTPWGGANQFLKFLFSEMNKKGYSVKNSKFNTQFLNSFHQIESYSSFALKYNKVVHRIDGPTYLIRGTDKELDDKLFSLNEKYADVSIFQSHWSLKKTFELGYNPKNPIVIPNCSNPELFENKWKNNLKPSLNEKIKIIGTSWSANERKGLNTYKWLDVNLDFEKYELTFVGNINADFKHIHVKPPMNSNELAKELVKHDIYLAPSENDPCSNALIEALTVGLPVAYKRSGGHPELVSEGGIGFNFDTEIPLSIEKMVTDYERFVNLIVAPDQYLTLKRYIDVLTF